MRSYPHEVKFAKPCGTAAMKQGKEGKSVKNRRIALKALFLAFLMASLMVCTAFAANKSVNVPRGSTKMTCVTVTTGKGCLYSWGWKKTTVKVTNNGSYEVTLYNPGLCGFYNLTPGRTVEVTSLGGSGKSYTYQIQGNSRGATKVSFETSAGSIG